MIRKDKDAVLSSIREQVSGAKTAVLINYQGLSVEDTNKLRRELRKSQAELLVVKNRLFKIVAQESAFKVCAPYLIGPTAVALIGPDPVGATKALLAFATDHPKMAIKAAVLEGELIEGANVKLISELPTRDQLLARFAGALASPITSFVRVLNAPLQGMITALDAIVRQKEKEGGAAS